MSRILYVVLLLALPHPLQAQPEILEFWWSDTGARVSTAQGVIDHPALCARVRYDPGTVLVLTISKPGESHSALRWDLLFGGSTNAVRTSHLSRPLPRSVISLEERFWIVTVELLYVAGDLSKNLILEASTSRVSLFGVEHGEEMWDFVTNPDVAVAAPSTAVKMRSSTRCLMDVDTRWDG